MDFLNLFQKQRELDHHIQTKHGLERDNLLERKLLALHVEIGELANETRCFKFWSEKAPSPDNVILEEYVDGIHFLMSVGIEVQFDDVTDFHIPFMKKQEREQLVPYFLQVLEDISVFQKDLTRTAYVQLFSNYLLLGSALGFSDTDIINAYFKKNEVNYERQEKGY